MSSEHPCKYYLGILFGNNWHYIGMDCYSRMFGNGAGMFGNGAGMFGNSSTGVWKAEVVDMPFNYQGLVPHRCVSWLFGVDICSFLTVTL